MSGVVGSSGVHADPVFAVDVLSNGQVEVIYGRCGATETLTRVTCRLAILRRDITIRLFT